ncbi:MAG: hypothetical protein AB7V55_00365 [Oscillospiraceae bacterium]
MRASAHPEGPPGTAGEVCNTALLQYEINRLKSRFMLTKHLGNADESDNILLQQRIAQLEAGLRLAGRP